MDRNKKNGIIIAILAGAFFIFIIIGNIRHKDDPPREEPKTETISELVEQPEEPTPTEAPDPESEELSEPEKEEEPESERVAAYKAVIEASLKENFNNNYEVKVDEDAKIITINVWNDGIVQELAMAQQGEQKYIDDWNNLSEILRHTSETVYSSRNTFDLPDYHISLNLINNVNKENTLLTTLDNVIVYRALND